MSRLFETIRIENGTPMHLFFHLERMERSLKEISGSFLPDFTITVPAEFQRGIARCRIEYDAHFIGISFFPYQKKIIRSLKMVRCDPPDYHLKYTDRSELEQLLREKEDCDDILIVRNGLITDTSFSNVIFRKDDHWFTPEEPLLRGTCRERLIREGHLKTARISAEEVSGYDECRIINAMRYPEEEEGVRIVS